MALVDVVKQDIRDFATKGEQLFFNENDLQMNLSLYLLKREYYDDVDIEYHIPRSALGEAYPWPGNIYLDIVVRKGEEYLPIELKYATKRLASDKKITAVNRFGEVLPVDNDIIKTQGAIDIISYNFWKDVRRCELMRNRFPAVKNGLAVFFTNDPSFLRPRRKGSACELFAMDDERPHGPQIHWSGKTYEKMPDFTLDQDYNLTWEHCQLGGIPFDYCIVEI